MLTDIKGTLAFITDILSKDVLPYFEITHEYTASDLSSILSKFLIVQQSLISLDVTLESVVTDVEAKIDLFNTTSLQSQSSPSGVRQTVQSALVDANGNPNFITAGTGLSVNILGQTKSIVIHASGGEVSNDRLGKITTDTTVMNLQPSATNYIYSDIGIDGSITLGSTIRESKYTSGFLFDLVDAVPSMTSKTAPSGIVSCSTEISGYYDYYAFNNLTNYDWLATTVTGWLQYQFPSQKRIVAYKLYGSKDTLGRSPKNWTLEASNTGTFSGEQTVLDTQVNVSSWSLGVGKDFTILNPSDYTYYRLKITSNNGDVNYVGVSELNLYEESIIEGDFVFSIPNMKGFIFQNGALTDAYRVYIGEVLTSSTTVSSVTPYAINGYYDSGDFATTAISTVKNHNIGIYPTQSTLLLNGITQTAAISQSKNSYTWTASAGTSRIIAKRGW